MDWRLEEKHLKKYPHFDKFLPLHEIERIVSAPELVRQNAFFPFLRYSEEWQPFRSGTEKPKKKKRPIRYASRRDALIFAYYRHLLSERYEKILREYGIEDCPIAYRKIPASDGTHGKCNIDFAHDAFQQVRALGNCCAVTLDISSYFECIDHGCLREIWCRLLGVGHLPPDHAAVFKAITRYAVVDRDSAYERLGFIGMKQKADGRFLNGFLVPFKKMPMQLCSPREFREKICGKSADYSSLIEVNEKPYGIPQGAPISDLLANIYLLDFDLLMAVYVRERGGVYYRYSDDILILVPGDESAGRNTVKFAVDQIQSFGDKLVIKDEKTSLVKFEVTVDGDLHWTFIEGKQGKNGLEYLGFRFDGSNVYIRESTLSRLHRKITFAARREARAFVKRYNGKDLNFLIDHFNFREFERRFGRVEDFENASEYRQWTFWTYARRAAKIFDQSGRLIIKQLRNHKKFIRKTIEGELRKALYPSGQTTVQV